jgi:hypothetical protein
MLPLAVTLEKVICAGGVHCVVCEWKRRVDDGAGDRGLGRGPESQEDQDNHK